MCGQIINHFGTPVIIPGPTLEINGQANMSYVFTQTITSSFWK